MFLSNGDTEDPQKDEDQHVKDVKTRTGAS
jgi:hypothetical protein